MPVWTLATLGVSEKPEAYHNSKHQGGNDNWEAHRGEPFEKM